MKNLLIPIITFIGISINVFAEAKSNKELEGDKYYFVYSFDKAIDSYNHAKQLSIEGQRRLAKSYHNMDLNIQSDSVYSKLISTPGEILPEDYYNYSMVLKTNGKYDQAGIWMDKFKELKPDDLRAKDYAANKAELTNLLKDNGKYKIGPLNVNNDADDFGPCFYKNKIVFASSRGIDRLNEKKYNWNRKPFLDLYVSEMEGDQLKTPEIFDKSLNGKMHDGPASFSNDDTCMAFSRNNYDLKKKDRVVNIEICFSTYKDGKWSKPEPFVLNNKEYSVGHPCLTADGNTMYFTSDMPGGFGGVDIYRITKDEKGTWGKAENLGAKINTEGDELFPFFEENNDILFFASNGRFGLGGLDIFIREIKGSGFANIHNAGFPLNTQYDDFAAIVNDKMSKGYVSSNRSGGSGADDIYAFDLKDLDIHKKIEGIAKDKDGILIPKTFITLLDDKANVTDTLTTKDDGAYAFFVASGKSFKLTGKKETYLEGSSIANTLGKELIVKADVTLLKKEETVAQKIIPPIIEVGADLGKILNLNTETAYFDYGKYNIRPDAEIELAKIVTIMNENPKMIVQLSSYTDCRATKEYNQVLSDKRAKASAEYIKKRITKPERIYGKGHGEENHVNGCECEGIVVSDCSEGEYQKDRRTEFIIVSNNKAIESDKLISQK